MSIRVMTAVWDSNLPPKEKLLALCLADFANDEGRHIYPSVATMAAKSSMPERTVQYYLRKLQEREILVCEKEASRHNTRVYRLDVRGATHGTPDESRGARSDIRGATHGTPEIVEGCKNGHLGVQRVAPNPLEPPIVKGNRQKSTLVAPLRACFAEEIGYQHGEETKGEAIQTNKHLVSLAEAGATPEEIKRRIGVARRKWGTGVSITIKAIDYNWSQLKEDPVATNGAGSYVPPEEDPLYTFVN